MSANATTALGRSRSLRRPAGGESTNADDPRAQPQNASPSRLPVKGSSMSLRSNFNSTKPAATGLSGGAISGTERADGVVASSAAEKSKTRTLLGRSNSLRQAAREPGPKKTPPSTLLGRATSLRQPQALSSSKPSSSAETSRPPITARTRPTPGARPTSAGSSRPNMAAGAQGSQSQTKQKQTAMLGHSRSKSSATALTSATTLRPPEPTGQASFSAPRDIPQRMTSTRAAAGGAIGDRSRPPTTGGIATRAAAALHRRQASASTANNAASSLPSGLARPPMASQARKATPPGTLSSATSTSGAQTPPGATSASSGAAAPRLRPAFSTHQQHFSPAKSLAPKPLMTSILAPPSPSKLPANVAASAETSRLQTELLQLSLMHRGAGEVDAQWRASARKKLSVRFGALARESDAVSALERDVLEGRNAKALMEWTGRSGLDLKIQGLDSALSGLWALSEPGGKYAKAVRRFERWADRMEGIVAAREKGEGKTALLGEDGELVLIGDLDDVWRDECTALGRRLHEWRRLLRDLGDVPGDGDGKQASRSSVETVLEACRVMVSDMLAELAVMEQIARDAVAQETAWIRDMNREDEDEDGAEKGPQRPRAGAIWRAF